MATLATRMEQIERQLIEAELRKHGGNRDKTARALGLARSALFTRLARWRRTKASGAPQPWDETASAVEIIACARRLDMEAKILSSLSHGLTAAAKELTKSKRKAAARH